MQPTIFAAAQLLCATLFSSLYNSTGFVWTLASREQNHSSFKDTTAVLQIVDISPDEKASRSAKTVKDFSFRARLGAPIL